MAIIYYIERLVEWQWMNCWLLNRFCWDRETQPLLPAWQQKIILASLLRSTDSGVEGFVNCNTSGHWPDHVFKDQTLVREKVRISRVNMTQRENSTLGEKTIHGVGCIVEIVLKEQCAHNTITTNKCHVSHGIISPIVHRIVDMYHATLLLY